MTASSGMAFAAVPACMVPTVRTARSFIASSRAGISCRAMRICAAAVSGSTPIFGMEP